MPRVLSDASVHRRAFAILTAGVGANFVLDCVRDRGGYAEDRCGGDGTAGETHTRRRRPQDHPVRTPRDTLGISSFDQTQRRNNQSSWGVIELARLGRIQSIVDHVIR